MVPIAQQDLPLVDAWSVYVDEPDFADQLRKRADATHRILGAPGWPVPPE
jgi:hypothetical protein